MISAGRFIMVGRGDNIKSMAYVENIPSFLQFCLDLPQGCGCSTPWTSRISR